MRFKITFHRTGKQRMLPMDYQYYLSAWIYKVTGNADQAFANFLHTSGYSTGSKQFKLFNYSPLDFGRPILWKEKALFEIDAEQLSLKVSFHLADAAEKFITGLFNNQQAYLGDQYNGLDLVVKQIERFPEPALESTMQYRALSPVVISMQNDHTRYSRYLSPVDEGYEHLLRLNLLGKYRSVPFAPHLPDDFGFEFKLKGMAKSKLVTIKSFTPEQSKIRGFVFDFELTAPAEFHRLILSSGIGEKNSTGFGWVEINY